jgi:hypothetical protein
VVGRVGLKILRFRCITDDLALRRPGHSHPPPTHPRPQPLTQLAAFALSIDSTQSSEQVTRWLGGDSGLPDKRNRHPCVRRQGYCSCGMGEGCAQGVSIAHAPAQALRRAAGSSRGRTLALRLRGMSSRSCFHGRLDATQTSPADNCGSAARRLPKEKRAQERRGLRRWSRRQREAQREPIRLRARFRDSVSAERAISPHLRNPKKALPVITRLWRF